MNQNCFDCGSFDISNFSCINKYQCLKRQKFPFSSFPSVCDFCGFKGLMTVKISSDSKHPNFEYETNINPNLNSTFSIQKTICKDIYQCIENQYRHKLYFYNIIIHQQNLTKNI